MNFEEFKKMIRIDKISNSDCFGHHPMQLVVIHPNNNIDINALVHLKLEDVKQRVQEYLFKNKCDELMLSLDFPSNDEIKNDFIMMLHIKDTKLVDFEVKEYHIDNGEVININTQTKFNVITEIFNYMIRL